MWAVRSNIILVVSLVLFARGVYAADVNSQGLRRQYLDNENQWKLCDERLECVPARVPGNILLDLNRSSNPLEGFAELEWASQSLKTWIYHLNLTNFHGWADEESAQLRFEGIDTIASVKCNGNLLSSSFGETIVRNAWIPHTFPLPQLCNIRHGLHIEVVIYPALNETHRLKQEVFNDKFYPHTVNYNVWSEPTYRNLLRKPASDFGWVCFFMITYLNLKKLTIHVKNKGLGSKLSRRWINWSCCAGNWPTRSCLCGSWYICYSTF